MLDLEKARQELSQKSLDDVQTETAWTWASRAAVSFENCLSAVGIAKFTYFALGEEYMHEALEHAALVESQDVISQVKQELVPYQERAAQDADRMFGNGQKTNNP
jgi:hypothetical protein